VRPLRLACLALALVGCGQQPPKESAPAPKAPSQEPVASSARDRAKIHTELGVSYYEAAKLGVALEELNEAIRIDRAYAPAWNARALVHMDLREDARAESDFKQALRLDPVGSDTKNNYGMFLCQRNRGKDGIRYFMEAVKNPLYTTPDVAYKNAGLCSRNMGQMQEAEDYFARAVQVNPGQPQALFNLADIAFARGDAAAAKQHLDRYMRVAPQAGPEQLWLGARVEHALGDRTATLSYGNQLRRRFPAAPETKAFMEGRFR
jgi:type IV pilus assembly protein PilF